MLPQKHLLVLLGQGRLEAETDYGGLRSGWEVRMSTQQVWTILSRSLAVSPKGMLHNVPSNAI